MTTFLFTAVLVAYPTVWFAASAARPLLHADLSAHRGTNRTGDRTLRCCASRKLPAPSLASVSAPLGHDHWRGRAVDAAPLVCCTNSLAAHFYQPRWFSLTFAVLAASAVIALWKSYRRPRQLRAIFAAVAIAAIAGVGVAGFMVNVHTARWNDPTRDIAQLKDQLPPGTRLVSFSPVEHRFACYYRDPIAELDWPRTIDDLPPDVEYFCFMRQPDDTADSRAAGRGRSWYTTPGTLPFEWEEITSICVERQVYDDRREPSCLAVSCDPCKLPSQTSRNPSR